MVKPFEGVGLIYLIGVLSVLGITFLPKFINSFIINTSGNELSFMQINAVQFSLVGLIFIVIVGVIVGVVDND